MIRFVYLFWLVSSLSFSIGARADDSSSSTVSGSSLGSESTLRQEDVNGQSNVTPGKDVDDILTNKMMRAQSGSKSRWSVATQFYYNGGSISQPLAAQRPNISGVAGTTDYALLDGAISGKYNFSQTHSLMAGFGLRWITPFQSTHIPSGYNGTKFDVDNPYLIYQYIYKWSGIQSVLQLQPTAYTDANLVNEGFVSTLALSQNNVYEIDHSGLSLGLYLLVQGTYYDNNSPANLSKQADYVYNIDPFIEYVINDHFNLRTVTNLWNYEHYRSQPNGNTYQLDKVYQSIGVGISVTRDIFLYPNLQFLPDDIRADRTNVAINSAINIF